jgi:hypothetical protein
MSGVKFRTGFSLKIRRRRWLILAQGCFNPGFDGEERPNAESVREPGLANAFSVEFLCLVVPGLSLRSNPGLQFANAFGVDENLLKKTRLANLLHRDINDTKFSYGNSNQDNTLLVIRSFDSLST